MPSFSRIDIPPVVQIWGIILILTFTWGSSYLILKRLEEIILDPLQVVSGRMLCAGVLLFPFGIRSIPRIPAKAWVWLILFALITNVGLTYLNALAQTQLLSAVNAMLSALTPVMTFFIAFLLYRQRMIPMQVVSLVIGLGGTLLLIFASNDDTSLSFNPYALVAVLAAVAGGLSANMIKYNLGDLKMMEIASVGFLLVMPVTACYAYESGLFEALSGASGVLTTTQSQDALLYFLFLGAFANALGIILYVRLIQLSSPVFASLVNYLVPIVALFWGIMDGEVILLVHVMAMLLIILSVWLGNRYQS